MSLFRLGDFTLHSGDKSRWKIDCDILSTSDWDTLAFMIAEQITFNLVIGIPGGGDKLALALKQYETRFHVSKLVLLVDDVLTTGGSMEAYRKELLLKGLNVVGVVVFARGKCPPWIKPLFQYVGAERLDAGFRAEEQRPEIPPPGPENFVIKG